MNRNYSFDSSLNNNNNLNGSASGIGLSASTSGTVNTSYQPTIIGGQYNPLCFSKEVFTSDQFKVDQFITDCRKRVPLESVQKDLREYSKCLDSELVELINREYHSFFSLSSSLVGIDVVLNEFNDTLSSIKSEITTFKGDIHKVRECVEDKLKEKKQIDHTKKLLQLYISISESITHINNLFDQLKLFNNIGQVINSSGSNNSVLMSSPTSSAPTTFSSLNTTLTLESVIERISNSFYQIQNQLLTLSAEESKLKLFQTLNIKLEELSNQIESKIEPIYTETLRSSIKVDSEIIPKTITDILYNCLKLYQVIKKLPIPYKIFRKTIVKPHLSSIINLRNLEGNIKGSCDGLPIIYTHIKSFLESECLTFKKIYTRVNELFESSQYNFMNESVMPELDEQLGQLKSIYATGIPDLFFRTYNQSYQFIGTLEEMYDSVDQLRQLRQSQSYINFFKRWNFAVYFQLRFSEIAQQFEKQLNLSTCYDTVSNLQNPQLSSGSIFYLSQTTALTNALQQCWSPNIFIYDISSKFLKLFLQLIQRYEFYLCESIQQIESSDPSQKQQPQQQQTRSPIQNPNLTSPDQKSINKYSPQENLVYLYSDVLQLISKINNEYKDMILKAINNTLSEIEKLVIDSLSETVKSLETILGRISKIIIGHFSSKCSEGLTFINSLTTTYRLTNKPMPTKPSTYVQLLVNPFESFLSNKAISIPTSAKSQWSNEIFLPISEKFLENSNGVLSSFSKADEILNKLKKKTTTTTSASPLPTHNTDYDKMSLQLYLDVSKYGSLIQKLGVDIENSNSYQQLLQLVEPFKKYLTTPPPS